MNKYLIKWKFKTRAGFINKQKTVLAKNSVEAMFKISDKFDAHYDKIVSVTKK